MITNNEKVLTQLTSTLEHPDPKMLAFKVEIQTHVSLLKQIAESVKLKFKETTADTKRYNFRTKRGLFNGVGTVWKSITGNLDASDGEYYNECIEKVSRDEREVEILLKNQISVTTSVIKTFNTTLQKLQIDEEIFNQDILEVQKTVFNITNHMIIYETQIKVINLCESLMESYIFLENYLNDILNAITFARVKILHSSIITPIDLISSLQEISRSLVRNNLPLPTYSSNIAQYLEIIELDAYQSDAKVIFVLKIPLTNPETYTLYHLYPIPILDNRTGLHHILPTNEKYIARDDDSLLYIILRNLDNCKQLGVNTRICSDVLPYPIDSDAICEAQLLKQLAKLPATCQTSLLLARDYHVQELDDNYWLITVSDALPVTIKCANRDIVTQIIITNSLLTLQPECNAFIGSTRVHARYPVDKHKTITYQTHPVLIPFECCRNLPEKPHMPDLKPLKLSKIDVEDLSIAQHNLNQYSDELDKLINEPYIKKHMHWFTILTITLVVILVALYLLCKCRRRRPRRIGIAITNDEDPPIPPATYPKETLRRNIQKLLPKRRPSTRSVNETLEEEDAMELHG
jgi:hypothetical protein